jgi:chromosome partitioning protein
MGHLIAIGNLKGGTGKSTIAVNLASALAEAGHRTLLVDADSQGTASLWHAKGKLPIELARLPLTIDRSSGSWVADLLARKARFDRLIVDLPPQMGSGLASALLIADLFLVPVTPSGIDLAATGCALEVLQKARAMRGPTKPACMLTPSRVDRRTAIGRSIHGALSSFNLTVGPAIRQRSVHVRAFEAGMWIGDQAPNSSVADIVTRLEASGGVIGVGLLDLAVLDRDLEIELLFLCFHRGAARSRGVAGRRGGPDPRDRRSTVKGADLRPGSCAAGSQCGGETERWGVG